MMRRYRLNRVGVPGLVAAMVLLAGGLASPANAQVVQVTRADARHLVGFNLGYFIVNGEDSRVDDDVLLANLNDLAFQIEDFNNWTFGGEWLFGVGNYFETGVGVGYYQRTVTSVYRDFVNDNGSEIAQDLKLRIVPISATIRFLPLGRGAAVEPYIGGGIGIFNWRYTESGEFVDFSDGSIFREQYKADGTSVRARDRRGAAHSLGRRVHGRVRVPSGRRPKETPIRPRASFSAARSTSAGTPSRSRCTSASETYGVAR